MTALELSLQHFIIFLSSLAQWSGLETCNFNYAQQGCRLRKDLI
jgi:hypothetical protein